MDNLLKLAQAFAPELLPADQMQAQYEAETQRLASGVDAALRTPDALHAKKVKEDSAKAAYLREVEPGGSVYKDFENDIATSHARLHDLNELQTKAIADPGALTRSAGFLNLGSGPLPQALMAKVKAQKSHTLGVSSRFRQLLDLASAMKEGRAYEIGDAGSDVKPDQRKTAEREAVAKRYHAGDVSVEELANNPLFRDAYDTADDGSHQMKFIGGPEYMGSDAAKLRSAYSGLLDLAKKGQAAKYWYEHSGNYLLRAARGNKADADKMAQLLAIYSINANLDSNIRSMERVWSQYQSGLDQGTYVPLRGGQTSKQDRLAEMILYGGADWKGRKTNNFYNNLASVIDGGRDPNGVTIDRWAMRPFQYDLDIAGNPKKEYVPTDAQYGFVENLYRQAAKDLSAETGTKWLPRNVQSAVWVAQRAASDAEDEVPVAQRNIEGAKRRQAKLAPDEPRFSQLLIPGELDRRLTGLTNQYQNTVDGLKAKIELDHGKGLLGDDDYDKLNRMMEVAERLPDADIPQNNTYQLMFRRSRDAYANAISKVLTDFDMAKKWEEAEGQIESETGRLQQAGVPQDYDYVSAHERMGRGQFNLEFVPSPDAGDDVGHIDEAPWDVKERFSKELYPVVQEVLGRLGLPRGANLDTMAFGDYKGKQEPMVAADTVAPQALGGGTPDPSRRTDTTTGGLDPSALKKMRLAAAALAYVLRQDAVAYMALRPLTPGKDVMYALKSTPPAPMDELNKGFLDMRYGTKNPHPAALYGSKVPKPGSDRDITDPDTDQTDRANAAVYSFTKGAAPLDAWQRLLEKKDEVASKYGILPDALPIVWNPGAKGFTILNLTNNDWHTGSGGKLYSNRDFQKIADEIVGAVDDEDNRWDVAKKLYSNVGDLIWGSWKDSKEAPGGEDHRRIIRELGGDALVSALDDLFEKRVRPVYEKYRGWRDRDGGPETAPGSVLPEQVLASESAIRRRDQRTPGRPERVLARPLPASRSEREQAASVVRRLKARRLLLSESPHAPLRGEDEAILLRLVAGTASA